MKTPLLATSLLLLAGTSLIACQQMPEGEEPAPTYYGEAKPIIDAKCATCHRAGDIGPFPLTTFDEVMAFESAVRASIESGTMPPWQPDDACNTYLEDFDLTQSEKDQLLEWIDHGAIAGDPIETETDAPADPAPTFVADLQLQLPEAYAPVREPDDYRCQLIPWPAEETRYVTGVRVAPDQRAIVHHVIVFVVGPEQVETFRAYDEAEEGPGYTCYGGPRASDGGGAFANVDPATLLAALQAAGLTLADLQSGDLTNAEMTALLGELGGENLGGFASIGSWVPGTPANPYPEGTGIRVEPGSMIVAQVHYNTVSSAPVADQSTIEIATALTVEREATMLTALDFGWVSNGTFGEPMEIPAGEASVSHSTTLTFDSPLIARARQTLGLAADAPLVMHTANHHMHQLGTSQRSELRNAAGETTCLLDLPDWDFNWQGSYTLREPATLRPGGELWMGCSWDNSAANQPVIDGQVAAPSDVAWGEGTTDEMCLGAFYVTAE